MANTAEKATKTRTSKSVALTPSEQIRAKAGLLLMLRENKAKLEAEIDEVENELRDWVHETGEKTIGPVLAYERQSPPRLVGATGKKLEFLTEQLTNELPEHFWKRKLEITKMLAALDSDVNLKNQLQVKGLSIEQTSGWYFKAVAAQ